MLPAPTHFCRRCLLALPLLLLSSGLRGEEVLVAVAANFAAPMTELAQRFERQSGHELQLSFGASGRFFAQISNGAPYQVFLSADQDKPRRLVDSGLALADSRFTYALGALVLWSADAELDLSGPEVLRGSTYERLALANPRLAPYGQAAVEVLESLGLAEPSRSRWVMGENVAQTYQFVASGNASLGFVALSQVSAGGNLARGSGWLVPTHLHTPIRQDAVLLTRAADCAACRQFLDFLRTPEAAEVIRDFGYAVE